MTPQDLADLMARGKTDSTVFGATPSGVRPTDYAATKLPAAAQPTFLHSAVRRVPVKDQQGGTCVGNSIANCMTYLEWVEKQDVVAFDGEALNMRIVGKDFGQGAAASPHDVLDDVTKHGVQGQTGLYFPQGYAWVNTTDQEAIKAAMSAPGVVVTAAIWLQESFNGDYKGLVYLPYDGLPGNFGYHEITFVGYDSLGITFQNSWGTWWGNGGFGRLSWDYVLHRTGECWAITDNPDTVSSGFVKTFDYGTATETAVKHADLPTRKRPAVYLAKNDGRIWITDPWQAKRFGVDLTKVLVKDDTDAVWGLPVIGPDAPLNLR